MARLRCQQVRAGDAEDSAGVGAYPDRMSTKSDPSFFPSRAVEAQALELWRAGAEAPEIAAAIWPRGDAPITVDSLRNVLRLLDLQDAGAAPPDDLPADVQQAADYAQEGLKVAMTEVRIDTANAFMHKAAQGWVKTVLDIDRRRQERQIHRQQLAALSRAEKAAALARNPQVQADPFPSLRQN